MTKEPEVRQQIVPDSRSSCIKGSIAEVGTTTQMADEEKMSMSISIVDSYTEFREPLSNTIQGLFLCAFEALDPQYINT